MTPAYVRYVVAIPLSQRKGCDMNSICPECKSDQVYEKLSGKGDWIYKCANCGDVFDIEEREADHE